MVGELKFFASEAFNYKKALIRVAMSHIKTQDGIAASARISGIE